MSLRFSQELKLLLEQLSQRPLTLADLLHETAERSFGLMIGLLVLPFLLPMPPGFTVLSGTGCTVLGFQMILGWRSPRLPRRVGRLKFPPKTVSQMLALLQKLTRWLEWLVRPRWHHIAQHPLTWRLSGLCIVWLALLLMSPIPFTNPIPTVGILLFVVSLLESDGFLLCVSFGLTLFITAVIIGIAYLVWRSPELLQNL